MVVTKDKPEYTPVDPNFKPLPKYGHLSELDPIFATFKSVVDQQVDQLWTPSLNLEQFRAAWGGEQTKPADCPKEGEDVVTEKRKIPMRDGEEIEIKIYRAKNKKPGSTLVLHFHGGGWVVGGHHTECAESLMAAGKTNSVVVSVDYRMAPEYRFPYAFNDAFDSLKWSKANAEQLGVDPNKIILRGGSAGGQLAASVAIMARDEGITGILGQILCFLPTVHPKFQPKDKYEFGSWQQNIDASIVSAVQLEWFGDQYMPEPTDDWRMSPLLAPSLKGLPPALVVVAGYDPLRDDGLAYIERLKNEGVEVEELVAAGLPHAFYMFIDHPKAIEYHEKLLNFVKKYSE